LGIAKSGNGWILATTLVRSLLWALLVFAVLGSAALTANASTRLLGPPDQPVPVGYSAANYAAAADNQHASDACSDTNRTAATVDACEKQQVDQAYLATLRKVQSPSAADACSGASAECSYQQAQAQIQVEQQQLAAAQACKGNTSQRICAEMVTRSAMNAQVLIPGTPLPCPGYDPSLPAPDSCPPVTPRP
jgi:hypothetical protein